MKTAPMDHQREALARMEGREHFALFMDMGTGKTWTFLADLERLYCAGKTEGALVVAPKGVHTNWVRREIPEHLSCPHISVAFRSGAGKRESASFLKVLEPRRDGEVPKLRILAMNIDAITHAKGYDLAAKFLRAVKRPMMIIDESDLIKNPRSARTKAAMKLGRLAAWRRIGTGTPTPNSPLDVFSQMEFLEEGLLGTSSYPAFVAEYAQVLAPDHWLVKRLIDKSDAAAGGPGRGRLSFRPPQIIDKDPITGAPKWRNLDKLSAKLKPHSFRVLKEECLTLPPKVYKTVFFDLSPAQRAKYDSMEAHARLLLNEEVVAFQRTAALQKLQQLTSGFVLIEGQPTYTSECRARLDAFAIAIECIKTPFIVWAKFIEELRSLEEELRELGVSFVSYHGRTKDKDRERAVDDFQAGRVQCFLGQPQSGGVGLTLNKAQTVINYSHTYNSRVRLQSEDRAHRKGTERSVLYLDMVATDTIDESIAKAHQRKVSVSRQIHDDRGLNFELEDENTNAAEGWL